MNDEINELIAKQTPQIQKVARALQAAVLDIEPNLEQDASLKLGNVYFRHNGVVCAMSLHKAHVNLHFYKGVALTDPEGVLQGSGKALRHLKYKKVEDIDRPLLEKFVHEAYRLNAQ